MDKSFSVKIAADGKVEPQPPGTFPMARSNSAMAQQIAQAAIAFEAFTTGTVVQVFLLAHTLRDASRPPELLAPEAGAPAMHRTRPL